MENSEEGGFTEVGKGRINFPRIFGQSGRAGVKHYFVEQDQTPGNPLESAKISYEYLEKLEF